MLLSKPLAEALQDGMVRPRLKQLERQGARLEHVSLASEQGKARAFAKTEAFIYAGKPWQNSG